MREKKDRRFMGRFVPLLLFLAAIAALTGIVATDAPAQAATSSTAGFTVRQDIQNPLVKRAFSQLSPEGKGVAPGVEITDLSDEVYVLDLPSMGVHPIQGTPPRRFLPDGGAVGLGGAFMSISPDVVSQSVSSEVGIVSSSWTPSELVAISVNGGAP